jgi:hypothetical protein
MTRVFSFSTLVVVLALATAAPALASAPAPGGAGATDAFVASAARYDRGLEAQASEIFEAGHQFVGEVASGCGGVLKGIPQNPSFSQDIVIGQFEIATSAAYYIDALQPIRGLAARVASERGKLRYSDPVLTWEVRTDATALPALLALHPPDVCADARVLAAGNFKKITHAGRQFAANVDAVLTAADTAPSKLLRRMRPYAPGTVTAGLRRLATLATRVETKTGLKHHFSRLQRTLFAGRPPAERKDR